MHFEPDTKELVVDYPFEKKIVEYSSKLTVAKIKSIDIGVRNYNKDDSDKYIDGDNIHQLDKVIESIIDKVSNTKDKITIYIVVNKFKNDDNENDELFFYFMQFVDALIIQPSVILQCREINSYSMVKKILSKVRVNKLVLGNFTSECVDIMNSYDDFFGVNRIFIIGANVHKQANFCNFLNKFPNLKKLDLDYVKIDTTTTTTQSIMLKINPTNVSLFNSSDILYCLSHSMINNLKKIVINSTNIKNASIHGNIVDNIINNNPNIEYIKITTQTPFNKISELSTATIYNLQYRLPLKYMNIEKQFISSEATISIAKTNENLTHTTFYLDSMTSDDKVVGELISMLQCNRHITSLEFIYEYDRVEKYNNFLIDVMNSLVDLDITSLIFSGYSCVSDSDFESDESEEIDPDIITSSPIIQELLKIASNFNCLRHLSIKSDEHKIDATLNDLLLSLIDNKTIHTITLNYVYDINSECFTKTQFFDHNTSLFAIYYAGRDVAHEGFMRNKKNYVNVTRLNKTKVAALS
jgi:hypothetical protein